MTGTNEPPSSAGDGDRGTRRTSEEPGEPRTPGRAFVLTRTIDAPRELVFRAWTEVDHLARWFGPKGFPVFASKLDLRPGGVYHYGMRAANGTEMWGKWVFEEVVPPERLVFRNSFSDPQGSTTRHPMAPDWPLEMRSTITFAAHAGRTTLTLHAVAVNATDSERRAFEAGFSGMTVGWGCTIDQLVAELAHPTSR